MLQSLARLGYASKSLIYLIVGGLAAAAAAKQGGRVTDTSGALGVILAQPLGEPILIVLAIGLCGYAVWRVLDAWKDPDRHGTGFKGLTVRIGSVIRGGIYGALGVEALRLARGLRGSDGREAEMWTARVMALPLGDWLIGAAGVIVAIYGASELYNAIRHHKDASLDLSGLPRALRGPLAKISRFGVGARGVIIATLGVFLVRAAITHNPEEAAGSREVVIELATAVQGRWLLAAISAGLMAYGIDQALHARCRRIREVI